MKQGILYKKGILQRFNVPYMFYYEKKDEMTGTGPYLKYGKKGKTVNHVLDLSSCGCPGETVQIIKMPESKRKFKINSKNKSMEVKCESQNEWDEWASVLCAEGNNFLN